MILASRLVYKNLDSNHSDLAIFTAAVDQEVWNIVRQFKMAMSFGALHRFIKIIFQISLSMFGLKMVTDERY